MNWVSVKRVTLDVIALMCSSNVKDVSNTRPECFCNETCWIGLLLKKTGGCTTFLTLRVKIAPCACLDGSRLKLIFYWKVHSFILSKFSQNCLVAACKMFLGLIEDFLSDRYVD